MSGNVERFTGRVAACARYRERYDPEVVLPLLRAWCGLLPKWTVADVGAGTGLLSDVLLANGNRVIAVEPNAEMRAECLRLHTGNARLAVVDGTAEATGLGDGCVEMVSIGRALHWFDLGQAISEFRRILKPRGWVAVVAFGRADEGRGENVAYEEMLRGYTQDGRGTRAGYVIYGQLGEVFAPGTWHHAEVPGEMRLTWEELRGMTLSLSYAPLRGDSRSAGFLEKLREFFEEWQSEERVTLATRYWVNAGRLE